MLRERQSPSFETDGADRQPSTYRYVAHRCKSDFVDQGYHLDRCFTEPDFIANVASHER